MHYGRSDESYASGHGEHSYAQYEYTHERPEHQMRAVPQMNPLNTSSVYSPSGRAGQDGPGQGSYNLGDDDDQMTPAQPSQYGGGQRQAAGVELIAAIQRRDCNLVERLLSGIPPSTLVAPDPGNLNRTPLHFAVSVGDTDVIRAMVAHGCPVNQHSDDDGKTPLTLAMDMAGSTVEYMLREGKGRNLTHTDRVGRNLIHHLAGSRSNNRKDFVRLPLMQLLVEEHLVDPEARDDVDMTPLDIARSNYLHLEAQDQGQDIIRWLKAPRTTTKALTALKQSKSRGMRFILWHPWTRILCILLLMGCHCVAYAVDNEGRDAIRMRSFVFVFHVFNMIGASWPDDNNTDLLGLKLMCVVIGMVLGCMLGAFIHWVVMKKLLRLRIFSGNDYSTTEDPTEWRGVLFLVFYGAFVGVFCGGLVYNAWLPNFGNSHRYRGMNGDAGFTDLTTNKIFLGGSLILDWFILMTVIDAMVQHGIARTHTPFGAYNQFWSCFHSKWEYIRYPFFYLTWGLPTAGLIWFLVADPVNYQEALLYATDAQKVATSGCCLFLIVVVMLQEWMLPHLCATPVSVKLPGVPWGGNTSWLIWWCLSLVATLDGHMQYRLLYDWIWGPAPPGSTSTSSPIAPASSGSVSSGWSNSENATSSTSAASRLVAAPNEGIIWPELTHLQRFEFAAALIPGFLACFILMVFLIRNMDRCCMADRASSTVVPGDDSSPPTIRSGGEFSALKKGAAGGGGVTPRGGYPDRQPQSSTASYGGAGSKTKGDVWSASYNDDVIRLCALLDADNSLVNTRGGIGLNVDKKKRAVGLCRQTDHKRAATPLHYAIAGNAKSAVATLMSRGANPRVRTTHGMWTVREVAHIVGNDNLLDVL